MVFDMARVKSKVRAKNLAGAAPAITSRFESELKVQVNVIECARVCGVARDEAIAKPAPEGSAIGSFLRRRALQSAA